MGIELIYTPTFMNAAGRLEPKEHASVMATASRFFANPRHPSLRLHKIKARSGDVWSISDNMDLRIIVVKDHESWILVHVDHHDPAYAWAERRELGRNKQTGGFQIIEVEESVKRVDRIIERHVLADEPPLFANEDDAYLLSLGVPEPWLACLRRIRNEDHLLVACEALPEEVAERLLDLASGKFVTPPAPLDPSASVLAAEDARLYKPESQSELEMLLRAPMEKWLAFLHPDQKYLVTRELSGPARVSGAAGTGKTVVAMHRARHLARQGRKVLLTTFTNALTNNMVRNMGLLCNRLELSAISISTVYKQALRIVHMDDPSVAVAGFNEMATELKALALRHASGYDPKFVQAEWDNVVRLQGIQTWDVYRRARRTGRGRALSVKDRKQLWRVFGGVLERLKERNRLDWTGMCLRAAELLAEGRVRSPFSAVIVDEVQDLKPAELRFMKALEPERLMLCGDVGQRIYAGGFSLKALGIETRGRSAILRINYRTTAQIRADADRLLFGMELDDMEGGTEERGPSLALRSGDVPYLHGFEDERAEIDGAVVQVRHWLQLGIEAEAIGVFGPYNNDLTVLETALKRAGIGAARLSDKQAELTGKIGLGSMHVAKGLEFKAVLVYGISASKLPSARTYAIQDPLDRHNSLQMERRLLYVAMTRARDLLSVFWAESPSNFLETLIAVHQLEPDSTGTLGKDSPS